jgi:hypothetical protein
MQDAKIQEKHVKGGGVMSRNYMQKLRYAGIQDSTLRLQVTGFRICKDPK